MCRISQGITFSDTIEEGLTRYKQIVLSHRKAINGGVVITGKQPNIEVWATELTADVGERLLRQYKEMNEKREMPELWPSIERLLTLKIIVLGIIKGF